MTDKGDSPLFAPLEACFLGVIPRGHNSHRCGDILIAVGRLLAARDRIPFKVAPSKLSSSVISQRRKFSPLHAATTLRLPSSVASCWPWPHWGFDMGGGEII